MAKVKRGSIKSKSDNKKVKFFSVPQRSLINYEIDMSKDCEDPKVSIDLEDILKGSIVRVLLKYGEENQEAANKFLDETMIELKKKARFVRPVERSIVKQRRKRMKEITQQLGPVEAVKIWIKNRPLPKGVSQKEVSDLFRKFFNSVEIKDRPQPVDFSISQVMVNDYMCFQGEHLLRIPDGLIGVTGIYDDQEGRSNRAGKSAFLEAFLLALQGEGRKVKTNEELIFGDEKEMAVGIGIQNEDTITTVLREFNRSKGTVKINDNIMKVNEANTEVEKLIGMTKSDLIKTCFARQDDLKSILSQGSTQLKDDIIRWRGLEAWSQVENVLGEEVRKLEKEKNSASVILNSLQESLERGKPDPKLIKKLEKTLKLTEENNHRVDIAEDKLEIAIDQKDKAGLLAISERFVKSCSGVNVKVLAIVKKLGALLVKVNSAGVAMGISKSTFDECKRLQTEGFDGVCPVDQLKCPRKDKINNNSQKTEQKVKDAEKIFLSDKEKVRELKKEMLGLEGERKHLEEQQRTFKSSKEFIKNYSGPTLEDAKANLEVAQINIDLKKIDPNPIKNELVGYKADILSYEKDQKKALDLESEISKHSDELKVLRYTRLMCGKFGIPSMFIEDALEEISAQVNLILEDLGTNHKLQFDSERETKQLAKLCYECGTVFDKSAKVKFCNECGAERGKELSDELRPMVLEGDRKQTFGQDSGAGRALIALATRISMSKFLGASVLFLDEVCSSFDAYHLSLFIKLLHRLPKLGFRQVFVITHQKEVGEMLNVQILVRRFQDEGRSELSLAE